jgi:adenine-specific DNA-methyltransferase
MLLDELYNETISYSNSVSKITRKKIGQFFTPPLVAKYMANVVAGYEKVSIRILDPGAGTGMLSGAVCQEIINNEFIVTVHIDLFEMDENIIPSLQRNLILIQNDMEKSNKVLTYNIIQENFILYNRNLWESNTELENNLYDVIISNPPYKKIGKNDIEAVVMESVVHGQPNIYFLFMALAAKLLKQQGQMVFIVPRSFTSGAYFRKFREYFLNTISISNLHLFHSRGDVFDSDKVLQEAIILKAVKSKHKSDSILISASQNMYFEESFSRIVPYSSVVDMNSENLFIMIPTSDEEIALLSFINKWSFNLLSLGFKLKTGPVVDFRATDLLKEEAGDNTVPLLWANHFSNFGITFPVSDSKNLQYILNTNESKSLLLSSKDYILVKRFTSKEETRRIQCVLYFSENFTFKEVGIENHLNYILKLTGTMERDELFGLFALFNSSYIDTYYRILNGSTQVNASEVNAIPLPSLRDIRFIGRKLLEKDSNSHENCDNIIEELFFVSTVV